MSPARRWREVFPRAAKQPPPAHGVKMKKAGTTWWGQLWIDALVTVLRGDSGRLARGRTYARAGRAHDLEVKSGRVTARVTGSRASPYRIELALAQLGEATWRSAIAAMAAKAEFAAELLAGQMPREIDEVFRSAGSSLFPRSRADLTTRCSCPDSGDPCKHVAATHYVLGEALDRDPFLLFELRGHTKDEVLEELRLARAGSAHGDGARQGDVEESGGSGDAAGEISPRPPRVRRAKGGQARRRAPGPHGGLASPPPRPRDVGATPAAITMPGTLAAASYDLPREPVPTLHFAFEAPAVHGAVLRQLGVPSAWQADGSPADALAPMVRAAAAAARRMALAEPEPPATEPPAAEPRGPIRPRGAGARPRKRR
jgi:uncharacterized Zn finger protein